MRTHPSQARDNSVLASFRNSVVASIHPSGNRVFRSEFRRALLLSCHGACMYCGLWLFEPVDDERGEERMTIDHFHSSGSGGSDDIDNLVTCCKKCNSMKCGRSIEEFRWVLSFHTSKYYGVVTARQAKELIERGADLDIKMHRFFYETYGLEAQ